jgi:redox-sensitive bicupin YhaK (pirin superfamily)
MITVRKSAERGKTHIDWLESWHSFSFNNYHDPRHVQFGPLRVINEDIVAPGAGFPPHGHADMEIVTYIISGALAHKDSTGGEGTIRPGEIQRMSAGTGVRHSEFNASATEPCHLLQIWMLPAHRGNRPGYEQKQYDLVRAGNEMLPIVVSNSVRASQPQAVGIDQDITVYATRLNPSEERELSVAPGRKVWVQVAQGALAVNSVALSQGDGAAIEGETALTFHASAPSEILVFDLP